MLKHLKFAAIGFGLAYAATPTVAHEDVAPVWSLDGNHIYFYSYRMDAAQLYRMNPDGSEQTRITHSQFHNWWMQPVSDDGILIVSDKEEDERFGGSNLFVYSISKNTHTQTTNLPANNGQWAVAPSFSADRTHVAYQHLPNGFNKPGASVRLLNLQSGSETELLSEVELEPRSFLLAPDGNELIFSHKTDLYRSNLDGSRLQKIMEMPGGDKATFYDISLSPNGQTVTFSYAANGFKNTEIYRVDITGKNLQQLTDNDAPDLSVNWSPNGRHLVFASYRDGELGEIYVMNPDGSHQQNISNTGQPPVED